MLRRPRFVVLVAALALMLPGPAQAADPGIRLTATLGPRTIPMARVRTLSCHDFDHPILRCFRTPAQLEAAIRRATAHRFRDPGVRVQALAYVQVWEHAWYEGRTAAFSQSYTNLGSIGWNDTISSLRSINWGTAAFYKHAYYSGTSYHVCCNQNVYNVGATYNDTFSSVHD